MTEYRIILLHKYKVEQAEVISRLLLTFYSQITRIFGQIGMDRTFTFSYYIFILL